MGRKGRSKKQIREDFEESCILLSEGKTWAEIANIINTRRSIKLSSTEYAVAHNRLLNNANIDRNIELEKEVMLQDLESIMLKALIQFSESIGEQKTLTQSGVVDKSGKIVKPYMVIKKMKSHGASKFLNIYMKAFDRKIKLLGLDKPEDKSTDVILKNVVVIDNHGQHMSPITSEKEAIEYGKSIGFKLFDKLTPVYYWTKNSDKRIVVHQGGTSSSKTFSITQDYTRDCVEWDGQGKRVTTVVAETYNALERGALRDFKEVLKKSEILSSLIVNPDLVSGPFHFKSGAILEFVSLDKPSKAKHGKRRRLFLNEANHLNFESVDQMMGRTDDKIYIDYNPDAKFWVHHDLLGRPDVDYFISNFTHNPYCDEAIKRSILRKKSKWIDSGDVVLWEKYKKSGKKSDFKLWEQTSSTYWRNQWYVYGLGITGVTEGVVFQDINWIRYLPDGLIKKGYGLDFGLSTQKRL